LREDLAELIGIYREEAGVSLISVPTNGTFPDRALKLLEQTAGSGVVVNLIVSLDAEGEEHDRLRKTPGGFEKALGLIKRFKEERSRWPHANLVVSSVLSEDNAALVPALQDRLEREGVFEDGSVLHNVQSDQRLGVRSAEEAARVRERLPEGFLSRWYVSFLDRLVSRQVSEGRMLYSCVAGERLAVLLPDGTLHPCEPFAFEGHYKSFGGVPAEDHGYDFARAKKDPRWTQSRTSIEAGACKACPWSCAAAASMTYSPKNWPLILSRHAG